MPGVRRLSLCCGLPVVLCLLSASFTVLAAVGDSRSYVASRLDGNGRIIKAWIQGRRAGNRFLTIRQDHAGKIIAVCADPSPVPPGALYNPNTYSDRIATLTMNLLRRKGHGRTLAGFWDTPAGRTLAQRLETGDRPAPCS